VLIYFSTSTLFEICASPNKPANLAKEPLILAFFPTVWKKLEGRLNRFDDKDLIWNVKSIFMGFSWSQNNYKGMNLAWCLKAKVLNPKEPQKCFFTYNNFQKSYFLKKHHWIYIIMWSCWIRTRQIPTRRMD